MADQVTTLLQLVLQETGNNNNNWGEILNQQLQKVEQSVAGSTIVTVSAGTKALTDDEQRPQVLLITGNLTAESIIEVKPHLKTWIVLNSTTGNFACSIKTPGQPAYVLPRGQAVQVWCDGANIWPVGDAGKVPIGGFVWSFRTVGTADDLTDGDPSFKECDGRQLSRALYSRLYSRIGVTYGAGDNVSTFHLPNLIDTGRYVRSRGGNAGQVLGAKQDDLVKSHTHTATTADAGGHSHAGSSIASNGAHTHGYDGVSGSDVSSGGLATGTQNTKGVNYNTTSAGSHTHTLTIAHDGTHSHTVTVQADGGVETRPTSIVATPLIRVQ